MSDLQKQGINLIHLKKISLLFRNRIKELTSINQLHNKIVFRSNELNSNKLNKIYESEIYKNYSYLSSKKLELYNRTLFLYHKKIKNIVKNQNSTKKHLCHENLHSKFLLS